MRSRSATTGLIVEASRVFYEAVGTFYDPECGAAMRASGTSERKVYAGTGSSMSTRVFSKSYRVLEKAQKNLGESTHLIRKTR